MIEQDENSDKGDLALILFNLVHLVYFFCLNAACSDLDRHQITQIPCKRLFEGTKSE